MSFNVRTIHKHITYETEEVDVDDKSMFLRVLWDCENEKIDKLMDNDFCSKLGTKLNLMWIEKLKEMSDWKFGEKLYIFTKTNGDGFYNCWFSKKKEDVGCVIDFIVEKNGYVSRRYYNYYTTDEDEDDEIKYYVMLRPNSIYNDKNCDKLNKK